VDHPHFVPEPLQRIIDWRDSNPEPLLVTTVRKGSTLAGFCMSEESSLFNKERGVNTGWIDLLGVKPEFRRKGLARAMMADGIGWLLNRGMDTVYIGVLSKNERALDLYKSLGFEKDQESIWFERPLGDQTG